MKVLLINPHRMLKNPSNQFTSIPIGVIQLAAFLQINGFETSVLDCVGEDLKNFEKLNGVYRCGLGMDKVAQYIEIYKPNVVGISCSFTPRFPNAVRIANIIKQINPRIPVIVGGMHATVCVDKVLQEPSIDLVVMGEAEIPLLNLLNQLNTNTFKPEELKGICYKTPQELVINNDRVLVDNLDALPIPAYYSIPLTKYFKSRIRRDSLTEEVKQISIVTSRGCPFECTFCSSINFWGNICRQRSPMHILSEIEMLIMNYGIKEFSFEDDNLTLNKDRIVQLCREIIHRNIHIKWNTPNGVHISTLDLPLIRLMKSSGCRRLNFGIESGDENILKIMNKQISLDKVREVLKMCRDEGIVTLGYFVLGMPGETPESICKTIDFAKSLPLDEIGLFIATPFPATQLEKECKEKGYLKKEYTEISAEDDIENQIFFETPELPVEKLISYKNLFLKEFYKKKVFERPFYYLKRISKDLKLIRRFLWLG